MYYQRLDKSFLLWSGLDKICTFLILYLEDRLKHFGDFVLILKFESIIKENAILIIKKIGKNKF